MLIDFIDQLSVTMAGVQSKLQRDLTMRTRVERRFSIRDIASFLPMDSQYLTKLIAKSAEEDPDFPAGTKEGRERTFSPDEVMLMRGMLHNGGKRQFLHWRKPGENLPVVTFGAQKGGTGKSLTAAHFAQYISMHYGLRVGIIDMDPQATASLYFADADLELFSPNTASVDAFIGADAPEKVAATKELQEPTTDEMNAMWHKTPWPGVRLLPGSASIQNGDISLFFCAQKPGSAIYRVLKDAIDCWERAHPPRTSYDELWKADGSFNIYRYREALSETFDVVIIDQQPSLTLMQLNGLIAASSCIMPQTMKGFDLSTLTTYADSIGEYLYSIQSSRDGADEIRKIGAGQHKVLATIVQEANDQDLDHLVDLYSRAPDLFMKVWYVRSDAIANASEEYKSIYEYDPPRSRRASAKTFTDNANAVNDELVRTVLPHLPLRGYADEFIKERWNDDGETETHGQPTAADVDA
ncbi:hypothetical protein ATO8_18160 [Roseivivax marinus]|jgi:chromosome partitioning protein|uniref:CobQ/CobB/MinD/ParA nucleotide binding domain-containing protein n=1 Tax=Roseivivax marinus TaxID=1379903 RepID=W4HEW8_9RHOB|nr:ParA family protein [Roseivivax marinus]ETW11254.1 hypothetical protein ATO8_18160 [Roseivivax marinus]